jgi:hypothetical protein
LTDGQKKSSIYTGVAMGVAVAASTAASVALMVQKAKNASKLAISAKHAADACNGTYYFDTLSGACRPPDATTSLTNDVKVGATILPIKNSSAFQVGRQVLIDVGTAQQEANTIIKFGSIVLKTPLKYPHGPGAIIDMPGAAQSSTQMTVMLVLCIVVLPVLCCGAGFMTLLCIRSSRRSKKRSAYSQLPDASDSDEYETDREEVSPLLTAERAPRIYPNMVAQQPQQPPPVMTVAKQPPPMQPVKILAMREDPNFVIGAPPTYALPLPPESEIVEIRPQQALQPDMQRPLVYQKAS